MVAARIGGVNLYTHVISEEYEEASYLVVDKSSIEVAPTTPKSYAKALMDTPTQTYTKPWSTRAWGLQWNTHLDETQ